LGCLHGYERRAAALLSLRKLPALGMLCPRPADPQLYVVRHKRKRLAISPVEVGAKGLKTLKHLILTLEP
jgi:hypothetical protein